MSADRLKWGPTVNRRTGTLVLAASGLSLGIGLVGRDAAHLVTHPGIATSDKKTNGSVQPTPVEATPEAKVEAAVHPEFFGTPVVWNPQTNTHVFADINEYRIFPRRFINPNVGLWPLPIFEDPQKPNSFVSIPARSNEGYPLTVPGYTKPTTESQAHTYVAQTFLTDLPASNGIDTYGSPVTLLDIYGRPLATYDEEFTDAQGNKYLGSTWTRLTNDLGDPLDQEGNHIETFVPKALTDALELERIYDLTNVSGHGSYVKNDATDTEIAEEPTILPVHFVGKEMRVAEFQDNIPSDISNVSADEIVMYDRADVSVRGQSSAPEFFNKDVCIAPAGGHLYLVETDSMTYVPSIMVWNHEKTAANEASPFGILINKSGAWVNPDGTPSPMPLYVISENYQIDRPVPIKNFGQK